MNIGQKTNEALALLKDGDKRGAARVFNQLAYLLRAAADEDDRTNSPLALDTTIEELRKFGIGTRTINCLHSEGTKTWEDVLALSSSQLLRTPNFGRRSFAELVQLGWKHTPRDPEPYDPAAHAPPPGTDKIRAEIAARGLRYDGPPFPGFPGAEA
jgi:hypothetical protein